LLAGLIGNAPYTCRMNSMDDGGEGRKNFSLPYGKEHVAFLRDHFAIIPEPQLSSAQAHIVRPRESVTPLEEMSQDELCRTYFEGLASARQCIEDNKAKSARKIQEPLETFDVFSRRNAQAGVKLQKNAVTGTYIARVDAHSSSDRGKDFFENMYRVTGLACDPDTDQVQAFSKFHFQIREEFMKWNGRAQLGLLEEWVARMAPLSREEKMHLVMSSGLVNFFENVNSAFADTQEVGVRQRMKFSLDDAWALLHEL
jgi:hypothetical protein